MSYILQLQLNDINDSLQIGDCVYYSTTFTRKGVVTNLNDITNIIKFGTVKTINIEEKHVHVEGELNVDPPKKDDYIFFSKDNRANISSAKGYYAEVKIKNDDNKNYSEIFQITMGVDPSSK